eukprot:CAMPEP_0172516078 /NCGR_PEP_ID=MMETSP1066-20121228/273170_1 /TAXON_ID=671091 /ORGANISM="Coscinodiscus wailesii, Strain CCMP2513" /LENGTH=176 /DNA_ID=CAMNT_0013297399 /DNA_START=59 /DNA_END=589 /DNA_ORIENTATION=+
MNKRGIALLFFDILTIPSAHSAIHPIDMIEIGGFDAAEEKRDVELHKKEELLKELLNEYAAYEREDDDEEMRDIMYEMVLNKTEKQEEELPAYWRSRRKNRSSPDDDNLNRIQMEMQRYNEENDNRLSLDVDMMNKLAWRTNPVHVDAVKDDAYMMEYVESYESSVYQNIRLRAKR